MQKWIVLGTDKNSGEDRMLVVQCATREQASEIGNGAGINVQRVKLEGEADPQATQPPQSEPASTGRMTHAKTPRYTSIQTCASLFRLMAYVAIVGAFVSFVCVVGSLSQGSQISTFYALSWLLSCIISAVIDFAVAECLLAFRDMVINTWKIRDSIK